MPTILIILTIATCYAGPYVGEPLYCGGVYADTTTPWVALPLSEHGVSWE